MIYNIEDYSGFDKLKEMTAVCHQELENIDWDLFIKDIQLTEKETDVIGPSWRYGTGNAELLHECVESNTTGTVAPPTSELGTYMWFVFYPPGNDYVNYRINSLVQSTFPKTIESIRNLPGMHHANMNVISPKFRVPTHVDDPAGNIRSVLVTFKISNNNPELAVINLDGIDYNMKDTEYFVFKSQLEHYGDNSTDANWIVMALQIQNTEFI